MIELTETLVLKVIEQWSTTSVDLRFALCLFYEISRNLTQRYGLAPPSS